MRMIDLGGGTAYEYIGNSEREYQQLLQVVEDRRDSRDIEADLIPHFNVRPTLWACNPYTGKRLWNKAHRIIVQRQNGTQIVIE